MLVSADMTRSSRSGCWGSGHVAAPSAVRVPLILDELLEVFEILLDRSVIDAEDCAELLGEGHRIPAQLHRHATARLAQPVEGHDPGVIHVAAGAVPGDTLIRMLFRDLGVEFAFRAGNLHSPVGVGVVLLGDLLDEGEKAGKRLELCPLVIGRAHGYGYVDACHRLGHGGLLRWLNGGVDVTKLRWE